MATECTLLDELDSWFCAALDTIADPDVRRDVLLLVGGAATVDDVVTVTAGDCVAVHEHLLVYPPSAGGHALPLTPAFVEATGLRPESWPTVRVDPAGDAERLVTALAELDPGVDAERLRDLRMHAWRHELGTYVGVLARCYGSELPALLARGGDCPATRQGAGDIANLVPQQRRAADVLVG
jgi:hypothetical protein